MNLIIKTPTHLTLLPFSIQYEPDKDTFFQTLVKKNRLKDSGFLKRQLLTFSGYSCQNNQKVFGIIGQSGSGKSLFLKALCQKLPKSLETHLHHSTSDLLSGFHQLATYTTTSTLYLSAHDLQDIHFFQNISSQSQLKDFYSIKEDSWREFLDVIDGENWNVDFQNGSFDLERLSQGQRWRILFSQIYHSQAECICLDEIFSTVEKSLRVRMLDFLTLQCAKKNQKLILCEHHLEDIAPYCDQWLFFQKGVFLKSLTPEQGYFHPDNRDIALLCGEAFFFSIPEFQKTFLPPANSTLNAYLPKTHVTSMIFLTRPNWWKVSIDQNPNKLCLPVHFLESQFSGTSYLWKIQHRNPHASTWQNRIWYIKQPEKEPIHKKIFLIPNEKCHWIDL